MTIGSAISGLGGLVGSSKAADTAQSGAAAAAAASKAMFDTGTTYESPWINQGAAYRAPINDVLLGGTTGSGYYAGGGVNTMGGGYGPQVAGFGNFYANPNMPHTNTNTTSVSPNGDVTNGTAGPMPTAPSPLSNVNSGTAGPMPTAPAPAGTSTTATNPQADWASYFGGFNTADTNTNATTTATPTTGAATGTNAVQGTAYTGTNTIGGGTSGSATFDSTNGGAGYGTVGLGRVNLSYNPTDWNSFAQNYSMSPAAQYQMGIGDASVNNSAAAKGGLLSSGDLRNLMTTNQGIVSQDMYKQYGSMLQGQQQDYSQRLASLGLLQSQEQIGANAANTVMGGASSSGNAQANAISAGSTAASKDYANMFSGFGSGGQNLFGSGGIFSGGSATAA